MKRLIDVMMGAVKHFTPFDFAVFKIYLVSVGILLGGYFFMFWADHITWVWSVAIAGMIYVVAKLIRYAIKEIKLKQ